MRTTVDIVIPVLNEETSLECNIVKILNFIEKELCSKFFCRIIIADNGSTDKTPEIAKRLEQMFNGKVFYHRVSRKGVGLALKSTWASSDAEIVGYMDLDLATDLAHLPEALDALINKDADIVYGSRLHKNSAVIGRSLKREITSRAFNLILKLYLRTHFSDAMCGFKFLKQEHVNTLIKDGADSDGWFFSTELLVVSEWKGLYIFELPVKWTDDPESKVNIKKVTLEYINAMKHLKAKKVIF